MRELAAREPAVLAVSMAPGSQAEPAVVWAILRALGERMLVGRPANFGRAVGSVGMWRDRKSGAGCVVGAAEDPEQAYVRRCRASGSDSPVVVFLARRTLDAAISADLAAETFA